MPYVPILSRFALVFSRLCSGSISGKSFEHLSTNLHKEATGTFQDKKKLPRRVTISVVSGFALVNGKQP